MSLVGLLVPAGLVIGGVLLFSSAKANEKKKRVNAALDLGLDDVEIDDNDAQPPLPPAMTRAIPSNPMNHETFNAWWLQTSWVANGVMGFWTNLDGPTTTPADLLPNTDYTDVVLATNDGALWFYDDGWHPADLLAQDYDAWFNANN